MPIRLQFGPITFWRCQATLCFKTMDFTSDICVLKNSFFWLGVRFRMARWLVGDWGEFGELVFAVGLVVFNCCLLFFFLGGGANRNLHGTNDRHRTLRDIASCASWLVHWKKRCKLSSSRITSKDPLVHRISSSKSHCWYHLPRNRGPTPKKSMDDYAQCGVTIQITKSGTHRATHQYDPIHESSIVDNQGVWTLLSSLWIDPKHRSRMIPVCWKSDTSKNHWISEELLLITNCWLESLSLLKF